MTERSDPAFELYVHQLVGAVLDRLCLPFVMLDARARIVFANPMSEILLEDGRHISRDNDGVLAFRSVDSTSVAIGFLDAMHGPMDDVDIDMVIYGRPGQPPLFGSLARFEPPQYPAGAPLPPFGVLFIRGGNKDEGVEAARVLFGLSNAEALSVQAVLAGHATKQHARARNVSVHTTRKQLSTAMQKCGVSSQLQLQALIADLTVAPV